MKTEIVQHMCPFPSVTLSAIYDRDRLIHLGMFCEWGRIEYEHLHVRIGLYFLFARLSISFVFCPL